MTDSSFLPSSANAAEPDRNALLRQCSSLELAQALAEKLAIQPNDWHRLNSNRQVRAKEQTAAALVYLLKEQPEEALVRLQQSVGWLDRSISAPPCPTHGERHKKPQANS